MKLFSQLAILLALGTSVAWTDDLKGSLFSRDKADEPVEIAVWNLNHVQCLTTGAIRLEQVILWDFATWGVGREIRGADYMVRAWAFTRDTTPVERSRGRWVGRVKGKRVSARLFIETWTSFDPEVEDRKNFAEPLRKGLR